jgi:hypothetical protein
MKRNLKFEFFYFLYRVLNGWAIKCYEIYHAEFKKMSNEDK